MRVETASQRQPKSGLREISGFFFGTDPAVCRRSEKTEVREIKGCGGFLVVLFCWYSWNLLISNWLCLTPLQLQKDMQKLGRSQPPTTAGSTPQYFFWSILASCQGVLCPGSELWYIWASKWNQETISVSSGLSTWQSTTVSWCLFHAQFEYDHDIRICSLEDGWESRHICRFSSTRVSQAVESTWSQHSHLQWQQRSQECMMINPGLLMFYDFRRCTMITQSCNVALEARRCLFGFYASSLWAELVRQEVEVVASCSSRSPTTQRGDATRENRGRPSLMIHHSWMSCQMCWILHTPGSKTSEKVKQQRHLRKRNPSQNSSASKVWKKQQKSLRTWQLLHPTLLHDFFDPFLMSWAHRGHLRGLLRTPGRNSWI